MNTNQHRKYAQAWGDAITERREMMAAATGEDWSQAALARRLGVSPVTVWRWEHGKFAPGPEMQAALIRELHIPGDKLRELTLSAGAA